MNSVVVIPVTVLKTEEKCVLDLYPTFSATAAIVGRIPGDVSCRHASAIRYSPIRELKLFPVTELMACDMRRE